MSEQRKPRGGAAVKQRERLALEARLQQIRDQVDAGTLVIRQATRAERKRYGIRPKGGRK